MIEENAHEAAGSVHLDGQGRLGEFENRQGLLPSHAGKPFEELVHRRAAFKILEERLHRHACSLEHQALRLPLPQMRERWSNAKATVACVKLNRIPWTVAEREQRAGHRLRLLVEFLSLRLTARQSSIT